MYQSHSGGARVGAGLAVGALQLGIGVALLSTFAGGAITQVIHDHLGPPHWTYVPPPPKPPTDNKPHPAPHHADPLVIPQSPMPELDRQITLTPGPIPALPTPGGDDKAFLTDTPMPPTPTPALPVATARPLGDPGAWITPDDYPYRALREGWRGVTRLHLVIDGNGHVSRCTVTASSGHDALDAVACAKVSQRARFSPARDSTGAAHEGTYDNAIHWEIHEVVD